MLGEFALMVKANAKTSVFESLFARQFTYSIDQLNTSYFTPSRGQHHSFFRTNPSRVSQSQMGGSCNSERL